MLDILVKSLVEDLKWADLPKTTEGYSLPINPETVIKVKELDPGVLFFAVIGPCPELRKENLMIYLMKANFLGQGTGGASIGLDERENHLTLSLVLSYDMNYKQFRDALEDFVNYLDYWKAELEKHIRESGL